MNLRFVLTNENRVWLYISYFKISDWLPGRAQAWMAMRLIVTGLGLWRRAVGALGATPVKIVGSWCSDAVYVQIWIERLHGKKWDFFRVWSNSQHLKWSKALRIFTSFTWIETWPTFQIQRQNKATRSLYSSTWFDVPDDAWGLIVCGPLRSGSPVIKCNEFHRRKAGCVSYLWGSRSSWARWQRPYGQKIMKYHEITMSRCLPGCKPKVLYEFNACFCY